MEQVKLANIAKQASENAYAPYSNFKVGASLVTKDGKVYKGCNVENASYGLTNCAERTCLFGAYAHGVKKEDIVMMCIYSPKNHVVSPCGACRQVMSELIPSDCEVILAYGENGIIKTNMKELLPLSFTSEDMEND